MFRTGRIARRGRAMTTWVRERRLPAPERRAAQAERAAERQMRRERDQRAQRRGPCRGGRGRAAPVPELRPTQLRLRARRAVAPSPTGRVPGFRSGQRRHSGTLTPVPPRARRARPPGRSSQGGARPRARPTTPPRIGRGWPANGHVAPRHPRRGHGRPRGGLLEQRRHRLEPPLSLVAPPGQRPSARRRSVRSTRGATVFVEIGGTDPVRDNYDVRYALLHAVTLGRVSLVDVEPGESVAVVPITNLDDGSRLAFDRHRFVDAKVHRAQRGRTGEAMAGAGFEPAKAEPTDLQSVPFDRSGIPPGAAGSLACRLGRAPFLTNRLG